MMKKLVLGLAALVGLGAPAVSEPRVQMIDPKALLFSLPTISDEGAPLEPATAAPGPTDFVFHEDEWRQVEFYPRRRLPEVQRAMSELKVWEASHRVGNGWSQMYLRKLSSGGLLSQGTSAGTLGEQLGVPLGSAPMLFYSDTIAGRVKRGFSLALGGRVSLYGYENESGVAVLGAYLDAPADDQVLVRAFTRLSAVDDLILVDWRAQMIAVSAGRDGKIEVWRP